MGKKNKRKRNNEAEEANEKEHEPTEVEETEEETPKQHEGSAFNRDPNDSDCEEQPKRKKKKKQATAAEPSDKKGKKSNRQIKKEKHAQRQLEAQVAAKDQLKSQCLTYLSQWKHDKQNWKFMKAKQVWLYKNKFSSQLLPDATWPLLLEYFESAQGNIRKMLLDDANKIIKQMDEWTESRKGKKDTEEDSDNEGHTDISKPTDTTYIRARDLIQCLEE